MRNERGITLIALVVTIIILMILAGVAISLLSSDRSVMQGAQNASSEYSVGASNEKSLVDIMNNKIDEYKVEDGGGEEPVVDGTSAEDIIADITENNNASEYYGKYVTNYTPSGVTDIKWRIFYIGKDPVNEAAGTGENNIYLIADHYVPRTELPAGYNTTTLPNTGNNSYGSRTAYFSNLISLAAYSGGSSSIASDNPARNWLSIYWKALGTGTSGSNQNMQLVAYMLDTRVWSKFGVSGATKYVIGGPTLEMFAKSWNQTHNSPTLTPTANATGYYINGSYSVSGLSDTTNLWIPAAQYNANVTGYTEKEAYGMWVASPSYYGANSLMSVYYGGFVASATVTTLTLGFRPLVCLESNIQLSTNDEGATYQIVN